MQGGSEWECGVLTPIKARGKGRHCEVAAGFNYHDGVDRQAPTEALHEKEGVQQRKANPKKKQERRGRLTPIKGQCEVAARGELR